MKTHEVEGKIGGRLGPADGPEVDEVRHGHDAFHPGQVGYEGSHAYLHVRPVREMGQQGCRARDGEVGPHAGSLAVIQITGKPAGHQFLDAIPFSPSCRMCCLWYFHFGSGPG